MTTQEIHDLARWARYVVAYLTDEPVDIQLARRWANQVSDALERAREEQS